jgi:hypothetical protein
VDHSCGKCGAAVEDGRAFCQQCRAPQIHVQLAEPDTETMETSRSEANSIASDRISSFPPIDRLPTLRPSLSDQGIAGRAALKAGLLSIFLGMIPVIGIVLTGSLAAYFYRRDKGAAPTAGIGWRVGAAAGVVAFAINSLLLVIRIVVFHGQQQYIESVTKVAQMVGYNLTDPDIQASIHNLVTPAGMTVTFILGLIFTVLLAALGGAMAALVFKPGVRR